MKHYLSSLIIILLSISSCESQNKVIKQNNTYFSQAVKSELLNVIDKKNEYYLVAYDKLDSDIQIVQLNICNNCFLKELIDQSKSLIQISDDIVIKVLSKQEVDNYKSPSEKEVLEHTGGTFTLELDSKGKILKKYFSD